jgi:ATP-dependent Clp endopeptidase proteolytic subunit ClpP
MKKSWFSIRAAADAAVAEVSIYDEIGFWGVTAKDFISELQAKAGSAASINLSINSPGGSVFDGFAIYNALRATNKPVNVTIMGIAASMASVIAMAGTTISMPANSMIMVHNSISGVYGDAADLRDQAEILDKIDASIVAIYSARTGKSDAEVRDLMAADSFLTAAEALEFGFATEVTDDVTATAAFDVDRLPENVRALFTAARTEPTALPTPAPVAVAEITAQAAAAGLGDFVDALVLDDRITSADTLRAVLAESAEIVAVCRAVGCADQAPAHVRSRKALADVRAALNTARVAADEAAAVDTAARTSTLQPTAAAGLDPSAIWRDINSMKAGSKK